MPLKYRSLCSGSRGNAALLWTENSALLVDFAPGCQRDCRRTLAEARELCPGLDTVLVTHAHGDHINRNSLKVLAEAGFRVRCHPEVASQIKKKYTAEFAAVLAPFERSVTVGEFKIVSTPVDHAPGFRTTAFIITTAARKRKICIFTDFSAYSETHVADAAGSDLIFLEANHDLELLARYGHPGSEFHLSNKKAAQFLHRICVAGAAQPQAVVLGHLSEECNRPDLPAKEIAAFFGGKALPVRFSLQVAARREPGPVIVIK